MFNRPLPAPARDIALVIVRIMLGGVLFAHGWQKLVIDGIAGTYAQFDRMGVPLAIVSVSFVTVVEFVGSVLLVAGALTTAVVALDMMVLVGAAVFVNVTSGLIAANGGWELIIAIIACELALAAVGPGRYSIDHLISAHRAKTEAMHQRPAQAHRAPSGGGGTFSLSPHPSPQRPTGHLGISVSRTDSN